MLKDGTLLGDQTVGVQAASKGAANQCAMYRPHYRRDQQAQLHKALVQLAHAAGERVRRYARRLWGCSVRVAADREMRARTLQHNGLDPRQSLQVLSGTPQMRWIPNVVAWIVGGGAAFAF